MKQKFLHMLPIVALMMMAFSLQGCDRDEKTIDFSGLPQTAQQFILRFFPGTETAYSKWEKDDGRKEYEVLLSDGTELTFDSSGVWLSVDCVFSTLPAGIIPAAIADDMALRYPDARAYKIEKEPGGYEISIDRSLDLYYSADGKFIREQRDF